MIDEADWSRIARYFAGECSRDEWLATQAWLAEDQARLREAERLRELWAASALPARVPSSDAAWQRLSARLHVADGLMTVALHTTADTPAPPRFHWRRREARIRGALILAACIALMLGGAVVLRRDAVAKFWNTEVREPDAEKDREFQTARGQRAVVTLSDGSRVELGAESSMRVRPFRAGARELFLVGQAAFDVVRDPAHPFIVHSANAITEDLDTRFTIRAYPGDDRVEVLVTSGRVALRAVGAPPGSGTVLGPADLGVLDSIGRTTVRNGVDSSTYLAWTRDRFVFDDRPLDEVLPEIARWFDVRIELQNPQARRRRLTMNVPARSLAGVLGAATVPLGLHFTITDRTVVVR